MMPKALINLIKIFTSLATVAWVLLNIARADSISFQAAPSHSHLVVKVDPGVAYSVKKEAKALVLRLENLPHGWVSVAPKGLKIRSSGGGVVELELALSPKTKKSELEYFDYRNRSTSEITLDFWWKDQIAAKGTTLAPVAVTAAGQKAAPPKTPAMAKLKQKATVTSLRAAPSKASGKEPTTVVSRPDDKVGCANPLVPEKDGIVHFKILHRNYDYATFFNASTPDEGYAYPHVKPQHGEELGAKATETNHYRLAYKLYREKNFGLALRTIAFFEETYPQSSLRSEVEFLKANLFVQLSKRLYTPRYKELSVEIFKHLWIDAPETDKGKRSLNFLAVQTIGQRPPAEVLEYVVAGAELKTYDKSDLTPWVYRLAMAENLAEMGEHDRAERMYQNIADQENSVSSHAMLRLGEVFGARKLWERAVFAYERAIRLYPKEANGFPPIWFNLAEAYFRIGQLDDARRNYAAYIEKFPKDVEVWAPKLRLAEIAQMKLQKADPSQREEIRAAYERVINENPYTPGEILAHLRLSVCGHNPEFFGAFFEDRPHLVREKRLEHSLINPGQVDLWMDLAEARYYLWSGSYEKVLRFANKYGVKLPIMELGPSFQKVLSAALAAMVGQIARNEGKSNLLQLVEDYKDYAPHPEPFAYSLAILRSFQEKNNLQAVGHRLAPLEERLKEANADEKDWFLLTKARHLKMTGLHADKVIDALGGIREDGILGLEKLDMHSESELLRNNVDASIAIDTKMLEQSKYNSDARKRTFYSTELKPALMMKVTFRRIENLYKLGRHEDVVRKCDAAIFQLGAYTEFNDKIARIREYRALSLYEIKNYKMAAQAIQEILTDTKETPRRAEFEFKLGKSLVFSGQKKEGFETFRGLAKATAKDSPEIWKKSAQAELDQYEWEQGIKEELTSKKDRRSLK